MKKLSLFLAVPLGLIAATASAADVLTASTGMTVYTFDRDTGDKSSCYEACAAQWPAVPPGAISGADIGSAARSDGSQQATFKGKPIYFFSGDKKPGDANGDGVGGVWHAAGASPKAPAKKPATAPGAY